MSLKKSLSCLICFLSTFSINCFGSKHKTTISYIDINSKYSITGPLGIELGKGALLEVKKVVLPTKENPDTFEIYSVNGKKLKKPIQMTYKMFIISDTFKENATYQIKAYQDGAFTGIPEDALKENMVQTTQYTFTVFLVVIKVIR